MRQLMPKCVLSPCDDLGMDDPNTNTDFLNLDLMATVVLGYHSNNLWE